MNNEKHDPQMVFSWTDPKATGAKGWVVIHRVINGVSGGGIFMHANATLEETVDISANMSKKFTVTDPQIGGAKAGIRFDHADPRAKEVLRRFIKDHEVLLKNVWVTAGDLNTDDSFIEKVIHEDLGLPTCQSVLGRIIAKATGSQDRSTNLAKVLTLPASPYFPLIEGAVGYGIAAAIRECVPETVKKPLVMIQGFGAVGSSLAYFLQKQGIPVVAICDKDGFVFTDNSNGLNVELLLQWRGKQKDLLMQQNSPAHIIHEHSKNLLCNLNNFPATEGMHIEYRQSQDNLEFMKQFLRCCNADVFCPCATRYQVTPEVAKCLIETTWKYSENRWLISGANNPFGIFLHSALVEDKGEVVSIIKAANGSILPDWVANSGTAQLFHRILSLDFDHKTPNAESLILEACADPIRKFIQTALAICTAGDKLNLWEACHTLAQTKLTNPISLEQSKSVLNPGGSRYCFPPCKMNWNLNERYEQVMAVGEECINPEELKDLLAKCANPVAYDGFEPSGRMHIAQGLLKKINVDRMTQAGFTYIFWIADWFAYLNLKLDGNLSKIQTVGRYFIEVWKAAGMDMSRVKFVWASEEILSRFEEYFKLVLEISTKTTLKRIIRCTQIMGRAESDELNASQILYPCMQCADIFFLGVDVCQLGIDQRKVNMLAREFANTTGRKAPIILSHHMVKGLRENQQKMSKSDPDSAIFMEDSKQEVERKIKAAYCPEIVVENNPVVDYLKHIIFGSYDKVNIKRDSKHGGDLTFESYAEFETAYKSGGIHPKDLKETVAFYLNQLLQPVRDHFQYDATAKELYELVCQYRAESK